MIVQLPMGNGAVAVLFRLPASIWATSLHLVGDFNRWSTSETPLRRGNQYWEASLTLTAGQTYYYAYLVNGREWRTDVLGETRLLGMDPPPIILIPISIERWRRSSAY